MVQLTCCWCEQQYDAQTVCAVAAVFLRHAVVLHLAVLVVHALVVRHGTLFASHGTCNQAVMMVGCGVVIYLLHIRPDWGIPKTCSMHADCGAALFLHLLMLMSLHCCSGGCLGATDCRLQSTGSHVSDG
jgi:hypothetical protein